MASSLKFPAIILEAVILAQTQYHEKGESNHYQLHVRVPQNMLPEDLEISIFNKLDEKL